MKTATAEQNQYLVRPDLTSASRYDLCDLQGEAWLAQRIDQLTPTRDHWSALVKNRIAPSGWYEQWLDEDDDF